MKRDMDVVRAILIVIEDHPRGYAPDPLSVAGYSDEQIGYHVYLMGQAGLLEVSDSSHMDGPSPQAIAHSITWVGHEFSANTREEKNWLQAKKLVKGAGDVSFRVWASILETVVKGSLGL
jgi:hypothetical protein